MKLNKRTANYGLTIVFFIVSFYALFVRHDLILVWRSQIVWVIAMFILNRKSN